MFYKVIRNRQVIDVLSELVYVKYQMKHNILLLCNESDAQGVLSSDKSTAYHIPSLNRFPVDIYPNVTLEEITKTEYDRLHTLHLKTPEQIAEEIVAEMLERGVL